MWEDPIVAEVHRIREQLAAEHNFDIAAFFADIRLRQKELGSRLVKQANRSDKSNELACEMGASSSGSTSSEPSPAA
ncbi:MAG: hypothetical protein U0805_23160 [Pirellulales bacterium]